LCSYEFFGVALEADAEIGVNGVGKILRDFYSLECIVWIFFVFMFEG
jgi:hypothetical protein